MAELARLAYYGGRFRPGAAAAEELIGPRDLASARAGIAASANRLALNDGHTALRHARDAILRMRLLGASVEDRIDGQVQLVHTLAHMGAHREAEVEARKALRVARAAASEPEVARAQYALGFALWFEGSISAIDPFLAAEALTRRRAGAQWHWILFCLSACLRDHGHLDAADAYAIQSDVALRYERAWFEIRHRRPGSAARWIRPPISRDEIPFFRVVTAAIRLELGRSRRARAVMRGAVHAAEEFQRGGLLHWRWGALWLAAADQGGALAERQEIVGNLMQDLTHHSMRHWGFYDPTLLKPWSHMPATRDLIQRATEGGDVESLAAAHVPLLAPMLRLLNPEALAVLTEVGLSPAEIRTVSTAMRRWLERGAVRRTELASDLRIAEASVRSRMNAIRQKLGIGRTRGIEPFLYWLAEHDLLAPATQRRAIQLLSRSRAGGGRRPELQAE